MFRKICNYLTVFSISLMVFGSSVLANPAVSKGNTGDKAVIVDLSHGANYYNNFLVSGGKHLYTVKVAEGKQVKVIIHSSRDAAVKIQAPNGVTKIPPSGKYLEVNLLVGGEYTIEVSSLFISQYSFEVFNR